MFQFPEGSIKIADDARRKKEREEFQFPEGSIKIRRRRGRGRGLVVSIPRGFD